MAERSVVLEVQGLCAGHPGLALFDQWSAAWPAGAVLVRGEESSGKTTLLRVLAGELPAQAGRLVLHGVALGEAPDAYRSQVFWADPRAADSRDAVTARAWLAALPDRCPQWDAPALAAHVDGFALGPHLDKTFVMLSAGTRRKVLMAGALASGAALTLIDEPVAGLDKPSIAYLAQALAQVAAGGDRVVAVAHYDALPGVPWQVVAELPGGPGLRG